jgi:hypothetical protein
MAKRGGKRTGAGRKRNEPDTGDLRIGKGFASNVFSRIKELKLNATKADGKPGDEIKNAEDYALDILRPRDAASRDLFKLLLAYQLGKPVQPVITADTRETAPELDFGNLAMPASGNAKPGTARRPN